jgi:hypothetical protein
MEDSNRKECMKSEIVTVKGGQRKDLGHKSVKVPGTLGTADRNCKENKDRKKMG